MKDALTLLNQSINSDLMQKQLKELENQMDLISLSGETEITIKKTDYENLNLILNVLRKNGYYIYPKTNDTLDISWLPR